MLNLAEAIFLTARYVADCRVTVSQTGKWWPRRDWFRLHGDYLLVSLYRQAKFQ